MSTIMMKSRTVRLVLSLCAAAPLLRAQQTSTAAGYTVARRISIGGSGDWDFITVDTARHRLFIARDDRVMVVDPATGALLGEIRGLHGAQHVAVADRAGHGFITSGDDGKVTMFDLVTLKVLAKTIAAPDADVIVYDPVSDRVFSFNGTAKSATVIDPHSGARIGSIAMGASPEFGVIDGAGHIYVNLASTGEVAVVDTRSMRVARRWSIAPCRDPSGLALDVANQRVFSVCANRKMAVSDAASGAVLTTLPIGAGTDGVIFDPATGDALSSNGRGTITVIHEDSPARFRVAQTLTTAQGARTIALDPSAHRIYSVAMVRGKARVGRGKVKPAFTLLVIER